jgi:hypothetical protein
MAEFLFSFPCSFLKPATMPQITLSVPNEKMPIVQEFLQALGIEGQNISTIFQKQRKSKSNASSRSINFQQTLSWEYFSNELEFE